MPGPATQGRFLPSTPVASKTISTSTARIISSTNTIASVKVFNIAGVNIKTVSANRATIDIDLGSFANGMYLISVIDNKGATEVVKVVKE